MTQNAMPPDPWDTPAPAEPPAGAQTVPGTVESYTDTPPARREWNPLAKLDPIREPLKASDVGDGPSAVVLYQRWAGRQRLAYEDALTEVAMSEDNRGKDTIKLGTLRLYGVSLTVVGQEGFPTRPDGSEMFTGERVAIEQDLLALDEVTYNEIRDKALEIQPLPTMGESTATGDEAKGADAGDPSPTP